MIFIKKYSVYCIIGFLFLIRLYGIMDPPLEVNHHWRQVTGLMVARNYFEGNTDFLHPMIDDIGVGEAKSTGVIGMEFPLLNYTYALLAKMFGYDHWYGRLLVLVLSSIGLFYFYLLIKKFSQNERMANVAIALLGVSVWFCFSRKMMPDTVSISLAIGALFHALRFNESGRWFDMVIYGVLASLAVLIKIPAVVVLSPCCFLMFSMWKSNRVKALSFAMMSMAVLCICYYWYFFHNVKLSEESGIWYNTGESFADALNSIINNGSEVAAHFYFRTMMAYSVLPFLLIGLYFMVREKRRLWLAIAGLICLVFAMYALRSGRHFALQHYYMIPLAPLFAFIAAFGMVSLVKPRWVLALTILLCLESVANQQHDFRIHDRNLYKLRLTDIVHQYIPQDALIVINGEGNPQELYLSHRKGWVCSSEQMCDSVYLDRIYNSGARYAIINKHRMQEACLEDAVFEDNDFVIARLEFNSLK